MGETTVIRLCEQCQGRKVLAGMGGISRPCDLCKGVGFCEIPVKTNKDGTVTKKMGRKVGYRKKRLLPSFALIKKENVEIKEREAVQEQDKEVPASVPDDVA